MTPAAYALLIKIGLVLALVVGVVVGYKAWEHHLYHAGFTAGQDATIKKWNEANAKAIAERAAEAAKFQKEKDDALQQAAEREKHLRDDLAVVAAQRDGLQHDLTVSRAAIGTASLEALRKRVTALTDVFAACVDEYRLMAEKADRHAADALMFDKAWPTP